MLSMMHEFLVDMFRECPALAPELLCHTAGFDFHVGTSDSGSTAHATSAEFSEAKFTKVKAAKAKPTRVKSSRVEIKRNDILEYRADVVVRLEDAQGEVIKVIVVEVQLDRNREKRWTWPLYATGARARFTCPTALLVVAVDDGIARWSGEPISLDDNGSIFCPIAIGPSDFPTVTDIEQARGRPELVVLAAVAHGAQSDDTTDGASAAAKRAAVALRACETLDTQRSIRYADFVLASLGEAARLVLEKMMSLEHYEFQSDFAKKYVKQGREEGREACCKVLLRLLAQRFDDVPDAIRARIEHAEFDDLERWLDRVIPAETLAEVFDDE